MIESEVLFYDLQTILSGGGGAQEEETSIFSEVMEREEGK